MPRPAPAATAPSFSSFRDWRATSSSAAAAAGTAGSYAAPTTPEEDDNITTTTTTTTVPILVLFPRRDDDGEAEEGFSTTCLRADGLGGLAEFFVPGSPTFVRAAQPVILALSTLGGLAVLGALLTV